MSFNSNDNNSAMIHLGNYEEYFILYMDNELDEKGREMVENFLQEHPDLQGELQLLMSTRLEEETISFNKSSLFAESMKLSLVDEEMLLMVDGELSAERKKEVEQAIENNEHLGHQYDLLLATRLDQNEIIPYPNKKELYRYERSAVRMPWMRVAAAVLVLLTAGIIYFLVDKPAANTDDGLAGNLPAKERTTMPVVEKTREPQQTNRVIEQPILASTQTTPATKADQPSTRKDQRKPDGIKPETEPKEMDIQKDLYIADLGQENETPRTLRTATIETNITTEAVAMNGISTPSEIFNTSPVTSVLANRTTYTDTPTEESDDRDGKGSIKGFLRKATRLIERKTGIDPTNDGELLIGAVAINLK